MRWLVLIALVAVTGCTLPPAQDAVRGTQTNAGQLSPAARLKAEVAVQRFLTVVDTVEPVAESVCKQRTTGANCNFRIVVDDRPNQLPNAFQTQDRRGRPVIAFNIPLIATVRNADELAFVMGHEAAHHILGHIEQTRQNAIAGAVIWSGLASLSGASAEEIRGAEEFGAAVGARQYSQSFELEADELGTIIAFQAGYDPILGARFFETIADPGEQFLGSHPPNEARIRLVRETTARLTASP